MKDGHLKESEVDTKVIRRLSLQCHSQQHKRCLLYGSSKLTVPSSSLLHAVNEAVGMHCRVMDIDSGIMDFWHRFTTYSEHQQAINRSSHFLLKCLKEKVLCCYIKKCSFAQSSIEYLRYTLSQQGIPKGQKVLALK